MNVTLRKESLASTYEDLDMLIWKAVWNYWYSYGGELEELRAEANLLFVNAYDTYQETFGEITTWVYSQIYNRLRLAWSRRHSIETKQIPEDLEYPIKSPKKQRWEIWEELGRDAQTMLRALMNGTTELTEEDLEKGFRACQTRKNIKLHFRRLGWTHLRIKETIKEIKGIVNA